MKYNKYCSNKYSNKYSAENEEYTSNNFNGRCQEPEPEYPCNPQPQPECPCNIQPQSQPQCSCNQEPVEPDCSCNQGIVKPCPCTNCVQECRCCEGVSCNFDPNMVQGIRTIVKRLFDVKRSESCPASEELVIDGAEFTVDVELKADNCMCECNPVDETSKFICKCVTVEVLAVDLLAPPEVKFNGKTLVVAGSMEECYTGLIEKSMLKCMDKCNAEQGELCIRAEGWTIDAIITISGTIVTSGQTCEFKLVITPIAPIEMTDNSVFYMSDFCATDGELKLCFNPKVCFQADSIVGAADESVTVNGIMKLSMEAEVNIYKDQEVCIQAIIIG